MEFLVAAAILLVLLALRPTWSRYRKHKRLSAKAEEWLRSVPPLRVWAYEQVYEPLRSPDDPRIALALTSDDEIRAYVNSVLSGLKKRHSGIEIEHDEAPSEHWMIRLREEGGISEDYSVVARPEHKEFVVWYG